MRVIERIELYNPSGALLDSSGADLGGGEELTYNWTVTDSFEAPGDGGTPKLAWDGANLITTLSGALGHEIFLHQGLSANIQATIQPPEPFVPGSIGLRGAAWTGENLITVFDDGTEHRVYLHDGFSETILDSFAASGDVADIAWTGQDLVMLRTDIDVFKLCYGFSDSTQSAFSASSPNPTGVSWQGGSGNLISIDATTDLVYIHDGFSASILESFAAPSTNPQGIAWTGTKIITSNVSSTRMIYVHTSVLEEPDPGEAGGETDLYDALRSFPVVKRELGREDEIALEILPGSRWESVLASRQKLKVYYDDGTFEEWRIRHVRSETSGQGTRVSGASIWVDLHDRAMKRVLQPEDRISLGVTMMNLTASEALQAVLSSEYDAPAGFGAGTVDALYSDVKPVVEGVGITHLEAIRQITEQLEAEWELRYDSAAGIYRVDIVQEVGGGSASLRPIDSPTGGAEASQGNRLELQVIDDGDQYYNRIIPLCGNQEHPTTIAEATWTVASAIVSGGSTTITLIEEPHPGVNEDILVGLKIGNEADGYFTVASVSGADTIVVTGDASALHAGQVRFVQSGGTDLVALGLTGSSTVERTHFFSDIPPETNYADMAGVSADMSAGALLPNGISTTGAATAEFVTDALYVAFGKKSLKVTADAHDGVETIDIPVFTSAADPYVSALARLQVESGRVSMAIVDSTGAVHPPNSKAQTNQKAPTELAVAGVEPAPGPVKVRLKALEDGTVFYVDALTVTRSPQAVRYSTQMGPRALFVAGARMLLRTGGSSALSYEGQFIDAAYIDAGSSEVRLGDRVRVRDRYRNGAFEIDFEARIMEVEETESREGRIRKQVRLARRQDTATSRFVNAPAVPSAARTPERTDVLDLDLDGLTITVTADEIATVGADIDAVVDVIPLGDPLRLDVKAGTRLIIVDAYSVGSETEPYHQFVTVRTDALKNDALLSIESTALNVTTGQVIQLDHASVAAALEVALGEVSLSVTQEREGYNLTTLTNSLDPGNQVSSLSVAALPTAVAQDDVLKLTNLRTGTTWDVTMGADAAELVTTLSIAPFTPSEFVEPGSPLRLSDQSLRGLIKVNADGVAINASNHSGLNTLVAGIDLRVDDAESSITNSVQFNEVAGETRLVAGPGGSEFIVSADQVKIDATTTFSSGFDPSLLNQTIRAASAPATRSDGSSLKAGDTWIDTSTGNRAYVWDGAAWDQYADTVGVGGAGNEVIRTDTAPTLRGGGAALVTGDVWVETDEGDRPWSWNGSGWVRMFTEIDGGDILTNTVTLNELNFTPLSSTSGTNDIVATINSSGEGLRISGAKLHLDGTVTFSSGYDPTTKETPAGAQAKANAAESAANSYTNTQFGTLGDLAFDDLVELARLGSTVVSGGFIKTNLVKIDGSSAFGTGYDPTTKETPAGAQSKASAAETAANAYTNAQFGTLGDLAFETLVEQSMLGSTIIAGGYIQTNLVKIDGSSAFGSGYDPSSKETPSGAQAKANAAQAAAELYADGEVQTLQSSLGDVAFVDLVSTAMLDSTIIAGGFIKTSLIDVADVFAQNVSVAGSLTMGALGEITNANSDFAISGDGIVIEKYVSGYNGSVPRHLAIGDVLLYDTDNGAGNTAVFGRPFLSSSSDELHVTAGSGELRLIGGDVLITGWARFNNGEIEIDSEASLPPVTTNRLYNYNGDLFWAGTQLNTAGGGASSLNDLLDVVTSSEQDGDVLVYRGSTGDYENSNRAALKDATTTITGVWSFDENILTEKALGVGTYIRINEAAAPSTPAAGTIRLFAKTDGQLYWKDDSGTEHQIAEV